MQGFFSEEIDGVGMERNAENYEFDFKIFDVLLDLSQMIL